MNIFPAALKIIKSSDRLRRLPHKKKLIALVVFALSIITPMELTISGEFDIYPENNADIRAPVEAVIVEIYVKEGDAVKKGEVLFQLANPDLEARRQDLKSRLSDASSRYGMLIAGTRSEAINLAQKEIDTARTRLAHATTMVDEAKIIHDQKIRQADRSISLAKDQLSFAINDRERYAALLKKNIISEQKFSEIQQKVNIRQNALQESQALLRMTVADDLGEVRRERALAHGAYQEAQARLSLLLADSRSEELEAAQAAVASLETQLSLMNVDLSKMTVRSPEDGIVATEHLHELVGQLVRRGDLIAEVYDFHRVKAELLISEKDVGSIRIGQNVFLKARAFSSRAFAGKVVAIAPRTIISKDGLNHKMVRVTTEIANPDLALITGMTGHGKIYAGKRSVFSLITRRFIRYFRVEFWSWW